MKKIITLLVILTLVAITGTASAGQSADFTDDQGVLLPKFITLDVGVPSDYSIRLFQYNDTRVKYNVTYASPGLDVTLDHEYVEKAIDNINIAGVDYFLDVDLVTVNITDSQEVAVTKDGYSAVVLAQQVDEQGNVIYQDTLKLEASASQAFNARIPEFPTIALPVAAIIGLAFFMQRRKEE
ncbi:PEF-CTERM sorting domain-containing protein [Methanolobus vulcani]|uniref:PEF-CTERM sorting domain-containing protein n=1 Tax=Methanolobus vulcani TaxID=38026 RepID=A0A7Z8KSH7_9EURY|nr:PEF-CTERM sorting domain-containing protein [Methanolobus vulcani]TQD27679.1 PEF-CTERM sorting domain-containing protein [Methanolobus vulcani]